MKRLFLALAAAGALLSAPSQAAGTTVTGTIVSVAAYLTGDTAAVTYGMGAMMGSGGPRGSMMGGANGGYGMGAGTGWMHSCAGSLGLLTADGTLYLLVVTPGSTGGYGGYGLCSRIGSAATIEGREFSRGGMHAIEVESVR